MRYDPISLRLFLHIAHSGSISAASARMDLALAAASRRVLQLEADVGTPLLERRARGVTLTQAGLALLRHAQDIEDAYSRMRSDMAQHGRGVLGSVRVAANSSAVLQFLPADLRAFTTAHADLRIDLKERSSDEVIRAARDGTAEVGVCAARGLHADEGLHTIAYRSDQLVLLVPRRHALARRRSLVFEEALDAEFVAFPPGTALRSLANGEAQRAGVPLKVGIQVRGFDAMVRMVGAELGVALLPAGAVHEAHAASVKVLTLRNDWARREHCIVHRPLGSLAAPARLLIDFLARRAAEP